MRTTSVDVNWHFLLDDVWLWNWNWIRPVDWNWVRLWYRYFDPLDDVYLHGYFDWVWNWPVYLIWDPFLNVNWVRFWYMYRIWSIDWYFDRYYDLPFDVNWIRLRYWDGVGDHFWSISMVRVR